MNLITLRHNLRQQRRQLSESARQLAAAQVTQQLMQTDIVKQSLHVACYWAFDNELETHAIIQQLTIAGKICYLPVLDNMTKRLLFSPFQPGDHLAANRYGIFEPRSSADNAIALEQLDLILMPIVGFDMAGHRLGTGGGYYDRTLQFMQPLARPTKPYLLGLAYEFQRLDQVPTQPWDITLDAVMTEQNFYPAITLP